MTQRLQPLLRAGLTVVFVGTEPGRDSLRVRHYYANPTNSFYRDLCDGDVRLTDRELRPSEDKLLLEYGVGLDDVYDNPRLLERRIRKRTPHAVCFNSKNALARFAGVEPRTIPSTSWRGSAARRYAELGDITWAIDDSSSRCRYHPQRLVYLAELAKLLR